MSESKYWAADEEKIAEHIDKKNRDYQSWLSSSNFASRIKEQFATYYSLNNFGVRRDGALSRISANIFRNIVDHLAILVSQNKLSYEIAASTTDSDSMSQAIVSREYIDFLLSEKALDRELAAALLMGIMLNEAWLFAPWDANSGLGIAADPDTGESIKSGNQSFILLDPFSVARDTNNNQNRAWVIVRRDVNKYDLAAQYPKHATHILSLSKKHQSELNDFTERLAKDDDYVHVFQLFHDRTPALPEGRQALVCGEVVLEQSDLKYESIPVHRFCPAEMLSTGVGNSVASDIIGMQKAFDKILTAINSNQANLALTNFYSRHPISIQKIAEGFNVINSPEAPQALNLGQSNPESYQYINLLQSLIDKLSGVPEIARGVAPQGVTAASAMSLMLSQAIAFASPIQRRYAAFASDVATTCIHNMKRFCKEEILLSVAGKSNRGHIRKVKGSSFSKIDRVVATISNPVSQTQQGREQVAEKLLQSGMVDGRRYVEILNGAPVSALFEDEMDELSLVSAENEFLREGKPTRVLESDNHDLHKKRHLALLNNPILRANPVLVTAVLDHVEEHDMWSQPPMPPPPPGQPISSDGIEQPIPDRLAGVQPARLPNDAPPEAQMALDQQQENI